MITQLVSPSTATTVFSTDELPETVQGAVLQNITSPLVASESMAPTLQKGDRLELGQADNLQVGDVVVYRHDRLFICHRIHGIQGRRIFLRGDANAGPVDEVDIQSVVGRVEFLSRDGKRLAVPPSHHPPIQRRRSACTRSLTRNLVPGRWLTRRFITWVVDLPGIKHMFRFGLRRLMTIEIMERASLHSLDGYRSQQHFRLNELAHHQHDLSSLHDDDIVLVVRAGPILLGTCTPVPWDVHMLPFLESLVSEVLFESIGPFVLPPMPCRSIQRSTIDCRNQ